MPVPRHRHDHDVGLARGGGIRHPPDVGPRVEVSGRSERAVRAAGADEHGMARHREPPREPAPLVAGAAENADDKIGHAGACRVLVRRVLPLRHASDPAITGPPAQAGRTRHGGQAGRYGCAELGRPAP